jgi:hypothetical protein
MATKVATDWVGCRGDDGMEVLANGFGTERERENWRSGFTDGRRWPRTCSPRRNSSARLGLPE